MNWVQKIYNSIRDWKLPLWARTLLQSLNDIIITILKETGKAYIDFLKNKIIEAAQHSDWSNEKKFDYVFSEAKAGLMSFSIALRDSEIRALIEFLVNSLKKSSVI